MDNRDLATATPPDGEDQFGEFNLGIDFPSAAGPPFNFAEAKEKLHVMFDSLDDNLARIEALAAVIGGSPKVGLSFCCLSCAVNISQFP